MLYSKKINQSFPYFAHIKFTKKVFKLISFILHSTRTTEDLARFKETLAQTESRIPVIVNLGQKVLHTTSVEKKQTYKETIHKETKLESAL